MTKLTEADITNKIKQVKYLHDDLLTVCVLTLENGFKTVGTSACLDPVNYDQATGEKLAFENAKDKVWELEGYLLKELLRGRVGRGFAGGDD